MLLWCIMLVVALFFPVLMAAAGKAFLCGLPKKTNIAFGFRTQWSTINQDTWTFAHKHCGRLWLRSGLILLPLAILSMLLVFGRKAEIICAAAIAAAVVSLLVMAVTFALTEMALKRTFDAHGGRREQA